MNDLERTAERLRVAFRLLGRRAADVAGRGDPTRAEQEVLARLDEAGAMSPGELSAALRVRPQTTGQTLDALDRHGWIARAPHPSDRRRVLVSPSPAGRRALALGRSRRQAWLVRRLENLAPPERRLLQRAAALLERIAQEGDPAGPSRK